MPVPLQPTEKIQLQSFWNLIQTADERVQRELYVLLGAKYEVPAKKEHTVPSFLQMKGILPGNGSVDTDRQMRDEYLKEKYGL